MRIRAIGWWLLGMSLSGAYVAPAAAASVVIHQQGGADSISRSLLRGIFGMRVRAWPDGTPVRVFVLDDEEAVHVEFCKNVLRMYPYQLRQNWDRLVYSGTGQPPILVGSEQELLRRVAQTPGSIGYINKPDAIQPGDKLKVLNVHE